MPSTQGPQELLDLFYLSQVLLEQTGPDSTVSLLSLLHCAISHSMRPTPPMVLGRKWHMNHSAFGSPNLSDRFCPSVAVNQYFLLNVALKELKTYK